MTEGISEAASKNRRGRPRAFSADLMASYAWIYPDTKSERQRQNRAYANDALTALNLFPDQDGGRDAGLGWLADWAGANAGKAGSVKVAVLTELGRLLRAAGPQAMAGMARAICRMAGERDLRIKEAASVIRRARIGRSPRANDDALLTALCRVLDDYRAIHPCITHEQMLDALDVAVEAVHSLIDNRNAGGTHG